ncbi:hypothetical protein V6N13_137595 [Hibiscus sabdariffa]|uniref:Phytosulfokine receptor n=1 Tax=Hibiscus sabdariffa TaxID=183260 RepID=A0ABR2DK64_9ROSI
MYPTSNLRALDLSHNLLSGQIPGNITTLKSLVVLNLSYNSFSGSVLVNQGYQRFSGTLTGNRGPCGALTGEGCNGASLPEKAFEEVEGPILVWVFCVSAFVSFYFGVVGLFCWARARSYIRRCSYGLWHP